MRFEQYELQVVDYNGVPLPERCIDGRHIVEASIGQGFLVNLALYRETLGLNPLKSFAAYLSVDGNNIGYHRFHNDECRECVCFYGYGYSDADDPDVRRAFQFATAPTLTDYKDNLESGTGQVMARFYEVERCLEQDGNIGIYPVLNVPEAVKPENNKPHKQPSLMTQPGRTFTFPGASKPIPKPSVKVESTIQLPIRNVPVFTRAPAPAPVYSWRRMRGDPDATLMVKCHTVNTLNFLHLKHDADQARVAAFNAGNRITLDLTRDDEPPVYGDLVRPAAAPVELDVEDEVHEALFENVTSSSTAPAPSLAHAHTPGGQFDFALPSGPGTAAGKPVLRLKSRASKATKRKLEAAAAHTADAKHRAQRGGELQHARTTCSSSSGSSK